LLLIKLEGLPFRNVPALNAKHFLSATRRLMDGDDTEDKLVAL
jgi:hypothetical protein